MGKKSSIFFYNNITKNGLFNLLTRSSPRLVDFIRNEAPLDSILNHFLMECHKNFDDLFNDLIFIENDLIIVSEEFQNFVDDCPDINITKIVKQIHDAGKNALFYILNNLIIKRENEEKPHVIQAGTILLAAMMSTPFESDKFKQLVDLLELFKCQHFQVSCRYTKGIIIWLEELLIPPVDDSFIFSKVCIKKEELKKLKCSLPYYQPVITPNFISPSEFKKLKCYEKIYHISVNKKVYFKAEKKSKSVSKRSTSLQPSTSTTSNKTAATPMSDLIALPNMRFPIPVPKRIHPYRWSKAPNPDGNSLFPDIATPKYHDFIQHFKIIEAPTNGVRKSPARNLIVNDSLLAACDLTLSLGSSAQLTITFPNNPEDFIRAFEKELENKNGIFKIRTCIISMGLDFMVYDPNLNRAIRLTKKFIKDLIIRVYKLASNKSRLRFVIVNIPQVKDNSFCFSYKMDIDAVNEALAKFVEKEKPRLKEKWKIELELYDWAKEAAMFQKCSAISLKERHRVLRNGILKYK